MKEERRVDDIWRRVEEEVWVVRRRRKRGKGWWTEEEGAGRVRTEEEGE